MLSRPFWKDLAQLDNTCLTAETTCCPRWSLDCVVIGWQGVFPLDCKLPATGSVSFHLSVLKAGHSTHFVAGIQEMYVECVSE